MLSIGLFTILLLSNCKKVADSTTISEANQVNVKTVKPQYLQGSCPYDCTDTRCQGYLNGYCGASLSITKINSAPLTDTFVNSFNQLQLDFGELSRELGMPRTLQSSDIDFQNIYKSYDVNSPDGKALSANINLSSDTSKYRYVFTLFTDGTNYIKPMIVKTSDRDTCKYFDLTEGYILSVKDFTTSTPTYSLISGSYLGGSSFAPSGMILKPKFKITAACGYATMQCMENIYTKRGWLSVWATVQTLYLPTTGAAIAATCAIHNCKS